MAINWKIAAAGGAVAGLSLGGFALANADDTPSTDVRDVQLQSANESLASLSSPIKVAPPTTVKEASASPAPAPAPKAPTAVQSADSPAPAPKPAPKPAPAPAPAPDHSAASAASAASASPVQPRAGGSDDSASFSAGASS